MRPLSMACLVLAVGGALAAAAVTGPRPMEGGSGAIFRALPANLRSGLVAYWALDGSGEDLAGRANHLSPMEAGPRPDPLAFGGASSMTWPTGVSGLGLSPGFAFHSYLCPGCGALARPSLDLKGDFTLSAWARSSRSGPAADNTWWSYAVLGSDQVMLVAQATGGYPAPAIPTLTLVNGEKVVGRVANQAVDFRSRQGTERWMHLVAYRRGNTLGLWVEGTEAKGEATARVGAPGLFRVGVMASGYPWQGVVDEVSVWDRALSSQEIKALDQLQEGRVRR